METELKLAFPSEKELLSVMDAPWFLQNVEILSEKTEEYENRYLDTIDRDLSVSRTSLRVRHVVGEDYIHTVKAAPVPSDPAKKGLSSRYEWEIRTDRTDFDVEYFLSHAKDLKDPYEPLEKALCPVKGKQFQTVCTTAFQRHTITVFFKESKMEVCFDLGKCIGIKRSLPICEMEIELVSGDMASVTDLGRLVSDHISCRPLEISKFARCLMLMKEEENE
jgi:inorganic triphosphatase YgiF